MQYTNVMLYNINIYHFVLDSLDSLYQDILELTLESHGRHIRKNGYACAAIEPFWSMGVTKWLHFQSTDLKYCDQLHQVLPGLGRLNATGQASQVNVIQGKPN